MLCASRSSASRFAWACRSKRHIATIALIAFVAWYQNAAWTTGRARGPGLETVSEPQDQVCCEFGEDDEIQASPFTPVLSSKNIDPVFDVDPEFLSLVGPLQPALEQLLVQHLTARGARRTVEPLFC